jgi:hypothetical protein
MLKRTHLWFLASVLFSQGAIAGTDVGYELNTNALESTPATPIADHAVKIEDRTWAVPGVEQSINNSDLVIHLWNESDSPTRIAVPRFHSSHCLPANAAQPPQWIIDIIWPLTRDLWSDTGFGPNMPAPPTPIPPIPLRGFHGMNLATER